MQIKHKVLRPATFLVSRSFTNTEPQLCIGSSLYHMNTNDTELPILLLNPHNVEVTVKANTVIVKIEEVTTPSAHTKPIAARVKVHQKPSRTTQKRVEQIASMMGVDKLTKAEQPKAKELISRFQNVFALDSSELGLTHLTTFDIQTGDAVPVSTPRRRAPYFLRNEVKRQLKAGLESGRMKETSSPWSAPILMVQKSDGTWRLCVDYRGLNSVTTSDPYPLPNMNDCLENLRDATIFSTLDLVSGYWQIPASTTSSEKLAFSTDQGQFTWTVMPFGAKTAPAVFQRLMDMVLRGLQWDRIVCYFDDILIGTRTWKEHWVQFEAVLTRLQTAGLKVKASKVQLGKPEVDFLGHIVGNDLIKPNKKNRQSIWDVRAPTSKREAERVYGLFGYYRKFIDNFAHQAEPIRATIREARPGKQFNWTSDAQTALDTLKKALLSPHCILSLPDTGPDAPPLIVETDASDNQLGAVLMQAQKDGSERPIAFRSRTLSARQRNYQTREKEMFSAVEAFDDWRVYLSGRRFIWRTDHEALKWARTLQYKSRKIQRWLAEIADMDFVPQLRPGNQLLVSDALSRLSTTKVNAVTRRLTMQQLKGEQERDPFVCYARNSLASGRWGKVKPVEPAKSKFWNHKDSFCFGADGELRMKSDDLTKPEGFLVLPSNLVPATLEAFHDKTAHPGAASTSENIRRIYWWPDINKDITDYVRSCETCATTKPNLHPRVPPVQVTDTPSAPFEKLGVDLIGPFDPSTRGNRFALVVHCHLSKFTQAEPLPNKEAQTVANALERLLLLFGLRTRTIVSDRGTEFVSTCEHLSDRNKHPVYALLNQYHIHHSKTAAYHPQANGATERANQTLKAKLQATLIEHGTEWDDRMPSALFHMNNAVHTTTKVTPFKAAFGDDARNPFDPVDSTQNHANSHPHPLNNRELQATIRDRIIKEKTKRHEKSTNRQTRPYAPYTVGQYVYARKPPREKGYTGPWEIIQVRGEGSSYKLRHVKYHRWISRRAEHLKDAFIRPPRLRNSKRSQRKTNYLPDTNDNPKMPEHSTTDTDSDDELPPPPELPPTPASTNDEPDDGIMANTQNSDGQRQDNAMDTNVVDRDVDFSLAGSAQSTTDTIPPTSSNASDNAGTILNPNAMEYESTTNATSHIDDLRSIHEEVNESENIQNTTTSSRSTRSRQPPRRFGEWLVGDSADAEIDAT